MMGLRHSTFEMGCSFTISTRHASKAPRTNYESFYSVLIVDILVSKDYTV